MRCSRRASAAATATRDLPLPDGSSVPAATVQATSIAMMRDLFAADPDRFERLSSEAAGLFLDYSKNRVDGRTLELLVQMARER